VWYNNYGKKERYITMMKKTFVERKIGREVYKVTGIIANYTEAELIDFCDINNFGGYVKKYGNYVAYVTVYTD
jgi:hypothetical protein